MLKLDTYTTVFATLNFRCNVFHLLIFHWSINLHVSPLIKSRRGVVRSRDSSTAPREITLFLLTGEESKRNMYATPPCRAGQHTGKRKKSQLSIFRLVSCYCLFTEIT